MKKANKEIRESLKRNNIKHWKLADYLNISESTLVRKLRREISLDEKQKILNIISKVKKGEM